MSERIASAELTRIANIGAAPEITRVDRNFGLPTGLYALTVGSYLAFFAIMSAAFLTGELAIPMVIFVLYVVMAFGLCAQWTRMKPENRSAPLTWGQFANRGIVTHTGRLTAGQASAQVLIMPALIVVWGLSVAIIAAVVR
jgi:hypothetical protein